MNKKSKQKSSLNKSLIKFKKQNKKSKENSTGDSVTASNISLVKTLQQVWPDMLRTKMKNEFTINWTGTAGATNGFLAIGNDLHNSLSSSSGTPTSGANPVSSGASSSIYGIPTMLSLYQFYRIICSRIVVRTHSISTVTNDVGILYVVPFTAAQTSNLGNVNTWNQNLWDEFPYSMKKYIGGLTINNGVTLSRCFHTTKAFGLRFPFMVETSAYTGSSGNSVGNIWNWVLAWFPQTGNATAATSLVRLEYEIEWFGRTYLTAGTV